MGKLLSVKLGTNNCLTVRLDKKKNYRLSDLSSFLLDITQNSGYYSTYYCNFISEKKFIILFSTPDT